MTKLLLPILCSVFIFADAIKLDHARVESLGKIVQANAKITQLSNQQQQIVPILGGHIENYFVKAGEEVKKGDRVALIRSLELSRMTAEYLALVQQIKAAQYDLDTADKLYKKGVGSKQESNAKMITLQKIKSKKNTLKSQLEALGIDPGKLTNATDELVLYAHADGTVGKLLVPLHATVDAQTPLMVLVKQSSYYALAYLSMKDTENLDTKVKGWVTVAGDKYPCSFVQLLPEIDIETQRAQVLFWIEDDPKKLLLNAFVGIEISIPPYEKVVMIKKSALSLSNGEWIVFVPQEEEHHDEAAGKTDAKNHHAKDDHAKDNHNENEEGHAHEEEHEAVPYAPKVVEIIAYSGNKAAVRGVEVNEEYVSDGVYFVKSLMLKSSLGEHGH